jgi:hypothetical protein
MTTEGTALVPFASLQETLELGKLLAQSGFFEDARGAAQAVVKVLAGRELGFGPIASMTGIHIVSGKPTLSANLMAAALKRTRRYTYHILRLENDGCELEFFEDGESLGISSFTEIDARQAGVFDGRNAHTWRKYPRNMMFARALSNGARWFCPDIFGGPIYTPEELEVPVDEDGEVIDGQAKPVEAGSDGSSDPGTTSVASHPQPTNGNGRHKTAQISTPNWKGAAEELATRCPAYTKDDERPDFHGMARKAVEMGYPEITDGNLTEVIAALEQAAT